MEGTAEGGSRVRKTNSSAFGWTKQSARSTSRNVNLHLLLVFHEVNKSSCRARRLCRYISKPSPHSAQPRPSRQVESDALCGCSVEGHTSAVSLGRPTLSIQCTSNTSTPSPRILQKPLYSITPGYIRITHMRTHSLSRIPSSPLRRGRRASTL